MQFNLRLTSFNVDPIDTVLGYRNLDEFGQAQKALDNQVLLDCSPLVPRLSGTLEKSGILSTHIGSGLVVYYTPYARRQYYENNGNGIRSRLWFERAKASHLAEWGALVANITGGRCTIL